MNESVVLRPQKEGKQGPIPNFWMYFPLFSRQRAEKNDIFNIVTSFPKTNMLCHEENQLAWSHRSEGKN